MQSWLFLSLAIIAEVIATSFLKSSEGFTKLWPSLVVIVGYGLAFYFLSLTLKNISMGIAYAVWAGAGIVLITTAGWVFLGQKLNVPTMLGMGLIVAGVVVVNVFSSHNA